MHEVRDIKCQVEALDQLTHDTRLIRLSVTNGAPLEFSAGQYAKVIYANKVEKYYFAMMQMN